MEEFFCGALPINHPIDLLQTLLLPPAPLLLPPSPGQVHQAGQQDAATEHPAPACGRCLPGQVRNGTVR